MEILRFAPLIRVSTEKQKLKGESLKTQLTQIRQYVDLLHGSIPDHCLVYQGQEHATANQERVILDRLLNDSNKGLFDCVIVTDASRWSRDNLKSEVGLNILAENGIRFFVGVMEYDLHNPEHRFMLGMSTQINQLQASKQSQNSIINRIERAKRGLNAAGLLPYGRTFDKKTGVWGIDTEKQNLIKKAAERYLAGEGIPAIAVSLNFDAANLHRILTKHSGTTRTTNFKYKRINETISFEIPALLPEKTLKAIKERIELNKTNRGNIKNHYLLQGFIFCSSCGLKLKSHTNESKKQYYVHSKYRKECKFSKFVDANEIEVAVLLKLITTFGDADLIKKAIQAGSPDMEKVEELVKEKININLELKKIVLQKDKVIDLAAEGLLSNDEIKSKMSKLREKEEIHKNRLSLIESQLSNMPDNSQVEKISDYMIGIKKGIAKHPRNLYRQTFAQKRQLIENAFIGTDASGKRLGVYMTLIDGKFQYEIRGLFENTVNSLPITDEYLQETFGMQPTVVMSIPYQLQSIRETLKLNVQSQHSLYPAGRFF